MSSKTSLAYIDTAYKDVLERQTVTPPLSVLKDAEAAGVRNIAGFLVPDPALVETKVNNHLAKMQKYALDRAAIIGELGTHNIPVLATLPSATWNKICQASGLMQFSPSRSGEVPIGGVKRLSKKLTDRAENIAFVSAFLAAATVIMGIGIYFNQFPETIGQFVLAAILTIIPALAIAGFETGVGILDTPTDWVLNAILKRRGDHGLMKHLTFDDYTGHAAQLVLPAAPQDVREVLYRTDAAKLQMKVATVPEAVSFNPPLAEIVLATVHERRAEEARLAELARLQRSLDPIVYIEAKGVVAIIAQFGEFPVEKALIDRLVAEEVTEEAY